MTADSRPSFRVAALGFLLFLTTPALAQQPVTPKIVEGTQVQPAYPETARRLGIQGTTTLRVQVGADGQVGEVNVVQSAGHPDLDRAAAVRRWRFEPARRGKDAIPMTVQLAIKFTLETLDAPDPKPLGPLKAGVITALDGNVNAQRVAFPVAVSLKVNDDIFLQDTITTGDGARMEMVLDSKVLVSMPERTVVTISEVSGRGTLDLGAGQLTVNARGDRPQSGQALEIRTPNAVAILRGGARLRVETGSPTPQGRTAVTHIDVLDGSISVVINVDFGNQLLYRGTTPVPIDLGANQGLTITGEVPGAIRPLRAASPTR